jgi:hypothetical protein
MSYEANEVSIFPTTDALPSVYTYEIIESLAAVRKIIEELVSCGIDQVALVAIRLTFDADARFAQSSIQRSTEYLLSNLRVLVRKTDYVFLLGHTMYFVLRGSGLQGGAIVQARLWEALLWRVHNMSDLDMPRPRSMAIGHSGLQETQGHIDACIDGAAVVALRFDWFPEKPRRATKQAGREQPAEGSLDEELQTLARKLGIPYLTLLPRRLPVHLQRLVQPQLAQELHCYPVGRERDTLTVAMLDPQDYGALSRLREETGLHIFPVLANPQALEFALEQLV